MALSPLLDVDGAAAYLQIRPGTLRNWLSQGRLSYVKVGRLTRIAQAELDRYVIAHTVAGAEATNAAMALLPSHAVATRRKAVGQ
jgi:excisionase family DNA binding protein